MCDKPKGFKVFIFDISLCIGYNGKFEYLSKFATEAKVIKDRIVLIVPRGINADVDRIIEES